MPSAGGTRLFSPNQNGSAGTGRLRDSARRGNEFVSYFSALGWSVHGADNNMRADLFGPEGDTIWNRRRLEVACPGFVHHEVDIRDRAVCADLMAALLPE